MPKTKSADPERQPIISTGRRMNLRLRSSAHPSSLKIAHSAMLLQSWAHLSGKHHQLHSTRPKQNAVYSRTLRGCSCGPELYSHSFSNCCGHSRQSKPKVEIAIVPEKGPRAFRSAIVLPLLPGLMFYLKSSTLYYNGAVDGCDDLSICLMEDGMEHLNIMQMDMAVQPQARFSSAGRVSVCAMLTITNGAQRRARPNKILSKK